jgi:hypothetical protein
LGQSINRRVRREGLDPIYGQDQQFRISIRSLASLAILPPNLVDEGYDRLRNVAPQAALPIYDYFREYYFK